jgi:hypothetical protein
MACAWATFLCYFAMMAICYVWGQKEYRIPYAWKKLFAYIVIVVLLFFIHQGITHFIKGNLAGFIVATVLVFLYLWFVLNVEWKEFQSLPVVGKYFKDRKYIGQRK